MSNSLYHISYFSRSTLTGTDEEIKSGIDDILRVAQQRNQAAGVTGALLYSGGYFIQVLEGAEDAVEEIFESIQCDTRHRDVAVINNEYIDERNFPQWSMALAGFSADLIPGLDGILVLPEDIKGSPTGMALVKILTGLLQRYEESGA